jgi:transcriptional regulator with XRE-family HTH domain
MNPEGSPAAGETIGQRLKRLRLDRGLSQRELAAPGVSYAYISRIEAGTRQPSVKALRRLAGKLGVTADYLETGSDLDPARERELKLADLELSIRLKEEDGGEEKLRALIDEAVLAGDRTVGMRARVALAAVLHDHARYAEAVALLEVAIETEAFDPVANIDVYSQLARAYVETGNPRAAVDLFERCLDEVADGDDAALEARYATLLSYALSDMGDLARAEEVVRRALSRAKDTEDPYTRVRLYWSMARLAHHEGRSTVALSNVRKAIALLQATDDTLHLARAPVLAANISLARDDAKTAATHLDDAEQLFGSGAAAEDVVELKLRRSRVAYLQPDATTAVTLAREVIELIGDDDPVDEGLAFAALADGLALADDVPAADEAYRRATAALAEQGRWQAAATACRSWARMLRQVGREEQAMDVLDRAAELAMRAAPADTRTER